MPPKKKGIQPRRGGRGKVVAQEESEDEESNDDQKSEGSQSEDSEEEATPFLAQTQKGKA